MTSQDFAEARHVSIPSDTNLGLEVQEQIISEMELLEFPSRDVFCARLALSEGVTNAIRHGNRMDPAKKVSIAWTVSPEKVRVVIQDEGAGFQCEDVLDPTDDENLERPGGRGVMLIRSFMDVVSYNACGNQLTMEKYRTVEEAAE